MFTISDRMYDILKWVVGVLLPAFAALYAGISGVFGWPYGEEITSTIMAIVLFSGAFLQTSSASWAIKRAALTGTIMSDKNNDGIPDYPFKMNSDVYNALKWIAQVVLPAASVAYVALAKIWGLPFYDLVPSVVAAVVVFLSTSLQFSNTQYRLHEINPISVE